MFFFLQAFLNFNFNTRPTYIIYNGSQNGCADVFMASLCLFDGHTSACGQSHAPIEELSQLAPATLRNQNPAGSLV